MISRVLLLRRCEARESGTLICCNRFVEVFRGVWQTRTLQCGLPFTEEECVREFVELVAGCFGGDYNLVIVMTIGVQQTSGSGMSRL